MGIIKYLTVILCTLLTPIWLHAASIKITALPEDTTPTGEDLLITVDAPGTTPVNKKSTITNVLSVTPAVIDGSAHVHITAKQMSDPRCHVSNYGMADGADVSIGLPTVAANLYCFFEVDTARAYHWGVLADTNDNITIIAADGTVGSAGSDGAAAIMTAAQVGQSFICWSARTGASAYDWRCKAVAIGTSTFTSHAAF
jgi:hypothetical protein